MRKLFILFAACALIAAFTVPAIAKVHMGGIVFLDAYYHEFDKEACLASVGPGGTNDWSQTEMEIPDITRLYGKWTNDAGDVGMHIELGLGNQNGSEVQNNSVRLRHANAWWKINPTLTLLVGQADGSFSNLNVSQMLGEEGNRLHVIGLGFGNIYCGRNPQIRLEVKFSDAVSFKVALLDPHGAAGAIGNPGVGGTEESTLPRIDMVLPIKFGPLFLEPGLSYHKVEFDEVTAGMDDSFDIIAYGLGVKFSAGPLTISGEYTIGQNWANAGTDQNILQLWENVWGIGGVQINASGSFEDSDDFAYWVDLAYKAGTATFHFIYGCQGSEAWTAAGDVETERTMYGVSIPIAVAKTFIIRPEYMVYDWGEVKSPGAADTELGEEIVAGVQFQIVF